MFTNIKDCAGKVKKTRGFNFLLPERVSEVYN